MMQQIIPQHWMDTSIQPNASTSIVSYELNGEFETGGITHNITVGAEYLDTDNDNDRYHAHWLPDSDVLILILNCSRLHDRLIFLAE